MFSLDGAIDLHVHAAPDMTERSGDDIDIATDCARAGMAGMAVKGHVESTASRAYHVRRAIPGFNYIGGICLNYPVGGVNPAAVEACLRLGGRIVWMPSGHSRFHASITGSLGLWPGSGLSLPYPAGATGLTIVEDGELTASADGELTGAAKEVVALAREHNALVATSHLSPREGLALVRYCQAEGVKALVTHIRWTPEYDIEYARAATAAGACIEITASSVSGFAVRFPIEEAIALINEVSPRQIVLASDTGGVLAVAPHEALRVFGANLHRRGVGEDDLATMTRANPAYLVAE